MAGNDLPWAVGVCGAGVDFSAVAGPAGAAGWVSEEINLLLDPLSPTRGVRMWVPDLRAADWPLRELCGNAWVDQLTALHRQGTTDPVPFTMPATPAWRAIAEVARARWITESAMAPLDGSLLEVDIATRLAALPSVLGGSVATAAFDRCADRLAGLVTDLANGRLSPVAGQVVRMAGELAVWHLPPGHSSVGTIESGLRDAETSGSPARPAVPSSVRRLLDGLFRTFGDPALNLDGPEDSPKALVLNGSVDRRLVPPGLLLDGEDTVECTVGPDGDVRIRVPMRSGSDLDADLRARVVDGDTGDVLALCDLAAVGRDYSGTTSAARPLRPSDVVDVFMTSSRLTTERDPAQRGIRRINRMCARALSAERLAVAGHAPVEVWTSIAGLWRMAAVETEHLDRPVPWHQQCISHQSEALRRSGSAAHRLLLRNFPDLAPTDPDRWAGTTLAELAAVGLLYR